MVGYTRASQASARKQVIENRSPGTARRPANSIWAMFQRTTDKLERALDQIDSLRAQCEAQAEILKRYAKEREENDRQFNSMGWR